MFTRSARAWNVRRTFSPAKCLIQTTHSNHALPRIITLQHYSTESIINISSAVPSADPFANGERHDGFRGVLARIGCGQVLLRRGRVVEITPAGRAILER